MGFDDNEEIKSDGEDVEMDSEGALGFREHLDLSQLLLGIKEGRFFQGRLNVSRLTLDEATVNVSGLTEELLIQSQVQQNRALNADIVAVEVLPKAQWIKNYKQVPVDTCLDADAEAALPDDDGIEKPAEETTLMQQINMTQS